MDLSLAGAVRSKTIGFAVAMVGLGLAEQLGGVVTALVPDEYKGIAIAAVGLVVAVLRAVTDRPLSEK